jgi:hypothetical protein
MKTQKQIDAEIKKLEVVKSKVPSRTAFGDDNHAAIDAQIKVLTDSMDDGEIWDAWPEDEDDMHVRTAAQDAQKWRDDDDGDAPSKGWA